MKSIFHPLSDYLLINPVPLEETTESGIILLHNEHHTVQKGVVISLGAGNPANRREVKVKDIVLFHKNDGIRCKIDSHEYLILKEESLLAVI